MVGGYSAQSMGYVSGGPIGKARRATAEDLVVSILSTCLAFIRGERADGRHLLPDRRHYRPGERERSEGLSRNIVFDQISVGDGL